MVTPKSLKNFLQFCKKYQGNSKLKDYLESLVQDSLPQATDEEREVIINYLQCISPNSTCESPDSQEKFEKFLDYLVKAGQRQILSEDLDGVVQDMEGSTSKSTPESLESKQSKQSDKKSIDPEEEEKFKLEEKFKKYQDDKSKLSDELDLGKDFWEAFKRTFNKAPLEIKVPSEIKVPLKIWLWILIKILMHMIRRPFFWLAKQRTNSDIKNSVR